MKGMQCTSKAMPRERLLILPIIPCVYLSPADLIVYNIYEIFASMKFRRCLVLSTVEVTLVLTGLQEILSEINRLKMALDVHFVIPYYN